MNPQPWWRETRWQIAGFLAVAAALNYADRAALSAVLPELKREFALTDVQLGLFGSVFLWCYALGSPVAGAWADRQPRHRIVILSIVLWSAVTLLTGLATGFASLLCLRGALGLAECLYLPAATALIATHHASATRGRAMSIHSVGLNFGVVIGGSAAGFLADHFGWRAGFLVLGAAGALIGWAGQTLVAQPPAAGSPVPAASSERASVMDTLRYLAGVPSFHALLLKAILAGVGVWIFLTWLPLYLREAFDLSLGAAGFAGTFMLQGATVLGVAVGGWISDAVAAKDARRRLGVQGLSYLIAAPFLLLFLVRPSFGLIAAAVTVFSFFRGIGQASENPALCEVIPARFRSTAIGLMNTGATAAGGLGVLLAGFLKAAFGLGTVFAGIAGLFVVAGMAMLLAAWRWAGDDITRASTER
jgi:sugar phosphate permease